MSYKVKITPKFEKELKRLAKKYPSIRIEYPELVNSLKENPTQGVSIGNNCYKIRLSITSKGKGKSGGARVIACLQILDTVVYLLTIYDKSDQENIPAKELAELLRYISE
ncbi:type II toxin-antitoxin system RelE/ParE family toxin [Mucilaginibacter sp. OK098]|uniref:type II toxin-antitoxin system RelE/ParE family toxin n=1 Tax=Mucilaginibacter sp. OK098 TaxID=1855297 RepID=UPI0009236EF4|nr:type II toxin-antitoxin system RelE/ParE family toxin [Mucilaginibacter sp. OK098]SHM97806.1 mRNA-degrading endonuclease RelE, toxin component of the RelBE toxin-antitoxin system [Mucilaginibacter sp. OK098]